MFKWFDERVEHVGCAASSRFIDGNAMVAERTAVPPAAVPTGARLSRPPAACRRRVRLPSPPPSPASFLRARIPSRPPAGPRTFFSFTQR
jgi:hypothetical protein